MFNSHKIFVAFVAFTTLLVIASSEKQLHEPMTTESNIVEDYPAEIVLLRTFNDSLSNETISEYTYRCSAGIFNSDQVICSIEYHNEWPSATDVQDEFHCPSRGSDWPVSYFLVVILTSSPNVECYISDGGIGLGYIVVTIKAKNATYLHYMSELYN